MKTSYKAYSDSAYLKKEDFAKPVITEITDVDEEQIGAPGEKKRPKLVAYLEGYEKGLVLNLSNCQTLAAMSGSDNPKSWIGFRVEVFVNPSVSYGGHQVGGIRLRSAVETPEEVEEEKEQELF